MSEQKVIVAYKAFHKDLTCRGFQYEIGRTYEHQGNVQACESGFHAVENPLDMFSYYDLTDSRFCSVELSGEIARHAEDSKIAAGRITIKAEIGLPQIITDAVRWVMDLCKDVKAGSGAVQSASGDYSKLAASGNSSQLAASGYYSQLAASGDSSKLAASGDYSKLAASGYSSQLAASGNSSQLAASGNSSKLAASGNYSKLAASGKKSIVMAADTDCTAKVGEDGCIALAWWDSKAERPRVTVGYVGEEGIEANVAYCVRDGKLAKVDSDDDDAA
ncbi:hypothetical protein F0160_22525 [Paraburkholderia sp. JPY303]|uniref:DUF7666 domain-containing protein n=1 Tax=Paraburkholderia atlantica TaxID=2654982 RepID=UPI0015911EC9|nr:hypothetical protein [Paraburkholderia atlantica]NUY33263.1 hypothetical protein [Paraburkholderia atlantica]